MSVRGNRVVFSFLLPLPPPPAPLPLFFFSYSLFCFVLFVCLFACVVSVVFCVFVCFVVTLRHREESSFDASDCSYANFLTVNEEVP